MLRNLVDKRRLPFFFPSSQQSQNGELWRSCENFPGKNQRAKNLYRMPRVSMRTSRKSEYLSDCAINNPTTSKWWVDLVWSCCSALKSLYVGDTRVSSTWNLFRAGYWNLGLVREATPHSASRPDGRREEGDYLLSNAAIIQHLSVRTMEPFNN